MDSTISTTLLHAITFLLAPLSSHYPAPVLDALHLSLLSSFSRIDMKSRPHTILLSPTAPPPQSVLFALQTLQQFPVELRVHWADWMLLLGNGNQLMLTIVPGCVQVTIRDATTGVLNNTTVWNSALQARAPSPWGSCVRSRSSVLCSSSESSSAESVSSRASSPVVEDVVAVEAAETVLNDEDEIVYPVRTPAFFSQPVSKSGSALSAAAPEWYPAAASRPTHTKAASSVSKMAPVGTGKRAQYHGHSRSSSRSSTISAAPSLISSYSSASSASTLTSALASLALTSIRPPTLTSQSTGSSQSAFSSSPIPPSPTPSDVSENADGTFYLDASKDQLAVTEYECGKVGVLTGAVMLGVPKGKPAVKVVGNKAGVRRL